MTTIRPQPRPQMPVGLQAVQFQQAQQQQQQQQQGLQRPPLGMPIQPGAQQIRPGLQQSSQSPMQQAMRKVNSPHPRPMQPQPQPQPQPIGIRPQAFHQPHQQQAVGIAMGSPQQQPYGRRRKGKAGVVGAPQGGMASDEDGLISGDELDTIQQRDIALARYINNHDIVSEIVTALPISAIEIPKHYYEHLDKNELQKLISELEAEVDKLEMESGGDSRDDDEALEKKKHIELLELLKQCDLNE
ncbi:hypothetical protein EV182_006710, partial [Spiromyces aspiralis]